MNSYISVGRLSESLLLLSSVKEYSCKTFAEADHLTVCYGINKKAAYDFAVQCHWINEENGILNFTDRGDELINTFNISGLTPLLWRDALYDYISICRPAWANLTPNGRKEAYLFMTNDEKRCFNEAGLMDSTEDIIVDWWDNVSFQFREESQLTLGDIGRVGEKMTLKYEEKRTGIKPRWESIDSNYSGYDIASVKDYGVDETILIEVKSSTQKLNDAKMIITRNEWDVASCDYNSKRYYFYLWLLGTQNKIAIIPAALIKQHVPTDIGSGQWKTIEIPFNLFGQYFTEYTD